MADWPTGVGRRVLASTDSTMLEAARAAPALAGPEWVLALQQTAAKGRRGRAWAMPEGNFAASLTFCPTGGVPQIALRSFAAATALRAALVAVGCPEDALSLKWPNDVLLNGGKLAGILLESLGDGRGGVSHLIIGIGVNLAHAPSSAQVEPHAVTPVALGLDVTPEAFLDALAPAFATREHSLATYGFGPTRTEWLSHAARLGEVITARLPNEEIIGTFRTIDDEGNLILDTAKGRRAIAAADIYF
ncbi:biotin--[acetyl-CoA-carboxylase] ligase [Jannaschia sp. EhC01]|uniref:biotin--[biotin carboxyl-carrier protein] ligase n=1 Tax=Gymnodinialimonas phycosphaerae TaxID=2841589 RepID=A0A975TV35_9RHOB|nr:biotin--[acetyl-CoA-carboxylase] ligase [Gymnodinialimonas phycosphaerae]MBY4895220.1 biotin--[acetyl-CoA-carboxylase] ligase [Gymnodinialimonas phycosphaerae]OAN75843.1 biotin--[acetyl-CoA-carboxylase] ligase [Jannaschia sp. EhC01]